ncbi:MAG TPA: FAD binding domain-containing protein [Conexivisphaerales archaeon]|nr:FAD binding domain-containing protein [Conexivisphaerales archaeon]
MKVINHYDATSVADAVAMLDKYGTKAKVIGAGTDLMHQMKGFIRTDLPDYIINLKTIPNLSAISSDSSGLHIGPLATLASVASNSTVTATYPMLAAAAKNVATPNIRAVGTIGGNLCQEVWCWYYRWDRNMFNCLRKGGSTCYAQAGNNTFHSIFGGAGGCYAVAASDTASALLALGASVKTSKQTIALKSFFKNLSPGHVLAADEIITSIDVPTPPSDSKQVFIKQRLRQGFDFALAEVALLAAPKSSTITTASIWLNGVAPTPVEATGAESALKGNAIGATVAANAAAAAVTNAAPMTNNAYKVQIVKALVSKAILS